MAEAAKRCGQYYVNHRWLGGMLTNWKTISQSIRRLRELDEQMAEGGAGLTKKELLQLTPRAGQARARAGRHQGHGRPARPDLRDRHQQGSDRGPRGQQAGHSRWSPSLDTNSDPRGIRYPDPGQRRRQPRRPALSATWWSARCSTASRPRWWRAAPTWASARRSGGRAARPDGGDAAGGRRDRGRDAAGGRRDAARPPLVEVETGEAPLAPA